MGLWEAIVIICLAGIGLGALEELLKWRLKLRELKVKERELAVQERIQADELNAKILRMDDFGLSPAEVASLAEDVRRLREEVAQLRQETQSRSAGA